MTDRRHLVVVGASLAGLRGVEAARRAGFTGRVTLVGDEQHLPYDRPPLSKAHLAPGAADPAPPFRTREQLAELDVDLRLGARATGLDLHTRQVLLGEDRLGFDLLLIATGATARRLPGTDHLAGVHVVRTRDDADAVRAALDAGPRAVVVVGAGFIGSEVASAARSRGLDVTVVEAAPHPLSRSLGPELGAACAALHTRHGTRLRTGTGVAGLVSADGRGTGVRLTDGTELPADLVVVGIGAAPAVDWLTGSGVDLDDGVVCDATLQVLAGGEPVPGVHAAGDVARWPNAVVDRVVRLEHWTSAAEQGAAAVRNALDPAAAKPYGTVPYFWSDWYDHRIQFVGLPTHHHEVVTGRLDPAADEPAGLVALYRDGDRLAGVLLVDHPASTMKYRGLLQRRASWDEAVEFARTRHGGPVPAGSAVR